MATPLLLAAAAAPENPYGLLPALEQGGVIAWSVFIILVGMSVFSFYILFTKLLQQQKIINQGNKVRAAPPKRRLRKRQGRFWAPRHLPA